MTDSSAADRDRGDEAAVDGAPQLLVGFLTANRIFAASIDNAVALLISLLAAAAVYRLSQALAAILLLVAYLGYYYVTELIWGKTLGKAFFGLIVVRRDGTKATARDILIRTLCRVVDTNPLLFGGLPAMIVAALSRTRQRIGDHMAGTVVVRHI